jgi:uncharacterized membrane protein YjgN (DUF898 family)
MGAAVFAIGASLVVLVAVVAVLGLPLYCIVDAASRQSTDFEAADSNKTLWIVLPFVFGVLAAVVYLGVIRPKVKAAARNR